MDLHIAFRFGAKRLAQENRKYTSLHKQHGIDEHQWQILTQKDYWSVDQARQMRSIIAAVLEVSMTIAGMPAVPLPGQYAAALIAEVISPPNWMLACMKCPDTFDAMDASGIMTTHEVKTMSREQLMALTLAYGGDYIGEPPNTRLPRELVDEVVKANEV